MEGWGCLFLVLLQNDDETIWRAGGGGALRGGEIGKGAGGRGGGGDTAA